MAVDGWIVWKETREIDSGSSRSTVNVGSKHAHRGESLRSSLEEDEEDEEEQEEQEEEE